MEDELKALKITHEQIIKDLTKLQTANAQLENENTDLLINLREQKELSHRLFIEKEELNRAILLKQDAQIQSNEKILELQNEINRLRMPSTIITSVITPKRLTMNPTQPTFSGNKNENINDWLEIVKDNMDLSNVPNDDQVLMASSYLRLNALQFDQTIQNGHNTLLFLKKHSYQRITNKFYMIK